MASQEIQPKINYQENITKEPEKEENEELTTIEKIKLVGVLRQIKDEEMQQIIDYIEKEKSELIEKLSHTEMQLRVDLINKDIFNSLKKYII